MELNGKILTVQWVRSAAVFRTTFSMVGTKICYTGQVVAIPVHANQYQVWQEVFGQCKVEPDSSAAGLLE